MEQSSTGKILWELTDVNAQGQIKQFELGNGLLTTKEYYTYGLPVSIKTSNNVQKNEYDFNSFTGNLEWRSTTLSPAYGGQFLREDFTYDDNILKNRLETWTVQGGTTYSNTYLNNGNIETKTGIGTYDYSVNPEPFSVDRITEPESAYLSKVKENDHHINYTGFNKVNQLWATVNNDDPTTLMEFTYGPGRERCKTELYNEESLVKSKLYVGGDYEIETDAQGNTRELHYIGGGDGLFAIYIIDNKDEGTLNYIHKDYLGSYEVITNETGSVIERLSFDPWGRRRNPTNWTFEDVPDSYIFDRGYTGHEHIAEFELINMNGRIYDPFIARFLSPDNFVQSPNYSQSYNRYNYAFNNPLKYTDPSGYISIAAIIDFLLGSGGGEYGGTWNAGDASPTIFTSQNDADNFVCYNILGNNEGSNRNITPIYDSSGKPHYYDSNSGDVWNANENGFVSGFDLYPGQMFYDSKGNFNTFFSPYEVNIMANDQNGGGVPDWVTNTVSKTIPVAFSLEFTGAAESGGASSMSPLGGILITRGPDAWNYKNFSSAGVGGGWISASAMGVGYTYFYTGDISNFSTKTFEGWGNNLSVSGDAGFAVGVNVSWVQNPNAPGEYLIGVGGGAGFGIGPTIISGQYTRQFNHIFW